MDKFFEALISGIQKNIKNPKMYAIIAAGILVLTFVFPYIDANHFFFNRIEKRIDILQSISQIDEEKISQNPILKEEYDAIISGIDQQRNWTISNGAINSRQNINLKAVGLFKFLSGGILAWLIALCIPFMNTFESKKAKIAALIIILALGGCLGGIGYIIPTFFNSWINYIGWPVLQIIFVIGLAMKPKKQG